MKKLLIIAVIATSLVGCAAFKGQPVSLTYTTDGTNGFVIVDFHTNVVIIPVKTK